MEYQVHLTPVSRNIKTGPIPVSTTSFDTCPDACPMRASGCYAEYGPLVFHWRKVTEKIHGTSWDDFCKAIAKLPMGTIWRHNQAGDLPGNRVKIDAIAMRKLIAVNRKGRKKGFTFTHYDVENNVENRQIVKAANNEGFTVNLSANNLAHADRLVNTKTGPVVTILDKEIQGNVKITTPAGNKVVVCPATYRDDVTCASCKLCAVAKRNVIVGFPAHGNAKNKVSLIARGN